MPKTRKVVFSFDPEDHQATATINRPALRYYGGKFRLADWITSFFPEHTCYVEPFAGAASVLLSKSRAKVEVINDLDNNVVTFFRVLREQPEELLRLIELTPFSRAEFNEAFEPTDSDLERARRFFVRAWQGRTPSTHNARNSGWRFQKCLTKRTSLLKDWQNIRHLEAIALRLKNTFIENDRANLVIDRYDSQETLFYLDPPYLGSTRCASWKTKGYLHEMTDQDHIDLSVQLKRIKGMAIISGYRSDLYNDLYKDWHCEVKDALIDQGSKKTEYLYISPQAMEARKQRRLF